jgi:hypothetical protein
LKYILLHSKITISLYISLAISDIGNNKFVAISFYMFVYVGGFVQYKFPFEKWFDQLSNMYQQKI